MFRANPKGIIVEIISYIYVFLKSVLDFHSALIYFSWRVTLFFCFLFSDYVAAICLEHGKEQMTVKQSSFIRKKKSCSGKQLSDTVTFFYNNGSVYIKLFF